jgi:hypothetical protein
MAKNAPTASADRTTITTACLVSVMVFITHFTSQQYIGHASTWAIGSQSKADSNRKCYKVKQCVTLQMSLIDRKTRTVLRNVRIPKELNTLLQKDANSENRTVSALVVSILTKYAEWDRFTEKFGFVSIPRTNYKRMIESMDEQEYLAATEQDPSTFLEMVRFWYKQIDAASICAFSERISKYVGTAKCELEEKDGRYSITLQHDLGVRYSNQLKRIYAEGIQAALGIEPTIEVTGNSVFIRFSERAIRPN